MNRIQTTITLLSLLTSLSMTKVATASDHDDGENGLKSRELNLTDVYAFREDWQDDKATGGAGNLVLVMNSNPRSVARQQYYFNSIANYEFHLSRVLAANKDVRPTGSEDDVFRFNFEAPGTDGRQKIRLTWIRDGRLLGTVNAGITTNLADNNVAYVNNIGLASPSLGTGTISVYAGLREDPFFFDVEQYFRVRTTIAGGAGPSAFRSPSTAVDFAAGYNVNSIVMRIPIKFLQKSGETVYDVWETISLAQYIGQQPDAFNSFIYNLFPGVYDYFATPTKQIERLARPAINEGLILSNQNLNAFNAVPPSADLSPAAAPVRAEATTVLGAINAFAKKAGLNPPSVDDVATGFLPDVMRVDTALSIKVHEWAFNKDFAIVRGTTSAAMPTGGRKLVDDAPDVILSYLLAGKPSCGPTSPTASVPCAVTDNVNYAGNAGNAANPPHKLLFGQSAYNTAARFPFLAQPN